MTHAHKEWTYPIHLKLHTMKFYLPLRILYVGSLSLLLVNYPYINVDIDVVSEYVSDIVRDGKVQSNGRLITSVSESHIHSNCFHSSNFYCLILQSSEGEREKEREGRRGGERERGKRGRVRERGRI